MGFWKSIKQRFSKKADPSIVQMDQLMDFLGLDKGASREAITEATYYTCNKVLGEAIGKLPLHLLQMDEEGNTHSCVNEPIYRMVKERPNRFMTATAFWSSVEMSRNHYGNAFVLIEGYGAQMQLWLLPSDQVDVWYDDKLILSEVPDIWYRYATGGKYYVFPSSQILHFRTTHSNDGIMGLPIRKTLSGTVSGAKKAQELSNKLYSTGFTAKATLTYTGDLNDESEKRFLAHVEKFAKGEFSEDGIENIIPLPLGVKLEPLNIKLTDAQFLEIKQYTAMQIAAAFGIKPQQIGDYTKSSYASAEAQQMAFYVDTLLYIVKQYEEELSYKLLTEEQRSKGFYFKFNIDVILRADFASRVSALSTAVNSFLMTPNEARQKLDLGAVDGGDRLLGNGTSIPVEYTGSQYVEGINGTTQEGGETDGKSILQTG